MLSGFSQPFSEASPCRTPTGDSREKTLQFILITLVLSIGVAAIAQAVLEEDVIKLVAHDEQAIGPQMYSDIRGDAVIIGSSGQNSATIFVGDGKKWEKQAELLR